MSTLVMTRTVCCQAYKQFGERCGVCPNRPENREAVAKYRQESQSGLGCNRAHCSDSVLKHPSAMPSEQSGSCLFGSFAWSSDQSSLSRSGMVRYANGLGVGDDFCETLGLHPGRGGC